MTVAGFLYLACVDKWQVYAKPLAQVKAFCMELAGKNEETDLAGTPVQEDASGTSGSGNGENAEDTQETAESGSSAPADNDSMPEQPVADSEQSGTISEKRTESQFAGATRPASLMPRPNTPTRKPPRSNTL